MTPPNNDDRQDLLAKFREWAEKLAASDDPEIRAIYKGRLERLVPELIALGVDQANLVAGNSGIVVQDSDVRDIIQQLHIHIHASRSSEPPPDHAADALRQSYLSELVGRLNRIRLVGSDDWAARVKLSSIYTALMTDRPKDPQRLLGGIVDDPAAAELAHDGKTERLSAVDVLNRERALVLLGGPGSGKSTFATFVALCLGGACLSLPDVNLAALTRPLPKGKRDDEEKPQTWDHGALTPVLVELREFATSLPDPDTALPKEALWMYIATSLDPDFVKPLRETLLVQGGLVLLDGLDEVPDAHRRREQVKQAVQSFGRAFPRCRLLVTSRTYAYQRQEWRLDGFAEAEISPLSLQQIQTFVEAWYAHMASKTVARLTPDEAHIKAESLKARLARDERLANIADRPLLLTLIARLHMTKGGDLPSEREPIYDESVRMLINDWEQHKRRGSGQIEQPSLTEYLKLSGIDPLRKILQRLAYQAHAGQSDLKGAANIPQAAVVTALVDVARELSGEMVNPLLLEEYLRDRSGILRAHGMGVYQFPHRTFQEYLAARYLIEELEFPGELCRLVKTDVNRWREAAQLAAARNAEHAPASFWELIGELCPDEPTQVADADSALYGALMAGQALLETGLASKVQTVSARTKHRERVQRWMRHIVESGALSPADRLIAGDALAALGDDRPGVGLRPDGLPDIVWCEVPDDGPFLYGDDKQKRKLPAFRIAKYPITHAQFQAFVDAPDGWDNPAWWKGLAADEDDKQKVSAEWPIANRPRERVSWYAAVAFTRWLSHKLGLDISLPTEEQWEKAARGREGREYPWGNDYQVGYANIDGTDDSAKVGPNYLSQTSAVGMYPQGVSPYGLQDCAGNVWEWCLNEYRKPANTQVSGTETRVLRGGSWIFNHRLARCASRRSGGPGNLDRDSGLRCVLSPSSLKGSLPSG